MSLQSRPIPPIPDLTAKVARSAFRKGNVYMHMRDALGGNLLVVKMAVFPIIFLNRKPLIFV